MLWNYGLEKSVWKIKVAATKSCFQNKAESLQELATDVERLSHLAYPDYTVGLHRFVGGVQDL